MHLELELPFLCRGEVSFSETCIDMDCVKSDNDIVCGRGARQIESGLAGIGMMNLDAPCPRSLMKEGCQPREILHSQVLCTYQ